MMVSEPRYPWRFVLVYPGETALSLGYPPGHSITRL